MKIVKLLGALTAVGLLAGCAAPGESVKETEKTVSWYGLSGANLQSVKKMDDMSADDQIMLLACQNVNAYNTGEYLNFDGSVDQLDKGTTKSSLRDATLYQFELLASDFPEVSVYREGIISELASAGSNPDGFVALTKTCETYIEVLANIQKYYAPAATVQATCWNGAHIKATLQENKQGTWVTIGMVTKLTKDKEYCGNDYPYTAKFAVTRSTLDGDREFRVVYKSTIGETLNGKNSWTDDPQTLYQNETELYMG